jgi:hypothetical protein
MASAVPSGVRAVHTEKRLAELGITLPPVVAPVANYRSVVRSGNLLFTGAFTGLLCVTAFRRVRLRTPWCPS